jgi:CAAX prenyl protease-like protein
MASDPALRGGRTPETESIPAAERSSLPWVLPFAVFLALLALKDWLAPLGRWEYPLRVVILTAVLWIFSRHVISFRTRYTVGSIAVGLAVFAIWIGPDLLFPGYRSHWLFQNSITGTISSSINAAHLSDPMVLVFRSIRAIVLVAIIEELFWRGWLMRWIIDSEFWRVPLGAWSARAFWITAVLFASEHGPYWDVGLITGMIYNWWMIRTKSLGDCILMHGVTNAALSGYVIAAGKWEYWM